MKIFEGPETRTRVFNLRNHEVNTFEKKMTKTIPFLVKNGKENK